MPTLPKRLSQCLEFSVAEALLFSAWTLRLGLNFGPSAEYKIIAQTQPLHKRRRGTGSVLKEDGGDDAH